MNFIILVLYIALGVIVTVVLARVALRSKRRLDQRVAEFKAEQEQNQGPPINPYLALAELYAEDERRKRMKDKG